MNEFDPGMNPYGSFMTDPAVPEGTKARAGAKLADGVARADDEAIVEALRTVHDPEIPVNIYDLGLIYDTERLSDGDVKVLMTLTAPACPVAGEMPYDVAAAVAGVDGVGEVEVTLTWEPGWTPDKMSDDAKLILDMF
jgi:FeS assembly SUF system protein